MKILHIGKFYPPYFGGVEKVNFDLVEGLNARDIQTDVLCFNHKKGDLIEKLHGYNVYRANTLKVVASAPLSINFVKMLKSIQNEYDIIHIHLPNPMANFGVFLTNPKAKIVLHWHSDIVKQKMLLKLYTPIQNWLLKKADKIVATSPIYIEGSETLQKYKSKTTYIPLGIDKDEFIVNDDFVKALSKKYNNKRIVFSLGRLTYYKGFEYLIDASKYLPDDTVVLIGGIGELIEDLQKRINDKQLNKKVKLLGKIPFEELGSYYKLCDVFCMSSIEKSEAYGMVQVEAMAFGKPIVSTNINGSGVSWVNKDGFSGVVVKPKDPRSLSEGLARVLDNTHYRNMLSEGALKRYNKLFTKENMVREFKEAYKELI